LIPFAVTLAATLVGGFLLPWWWWPAMAAYAVGYWLGRAPLRAFLSGFSGAALAWGSLAAFLDWRNGHILSARIAAMLDLPTAHLLVALTALAGGVLGGLGAWAGQSLRAYILLRRREDGLGPV
jgi:hypothetical protein